MGGFPGTATGSMARPARPAVDPGERVFTPELQRAPRDLLGKALQRAVEAVALGEAVSHGLGGVDDERV
jgi:hypothetical protein